MVQEDGCGGERCSSVPEYDITFISTFTYSFVNKLISYGASTTNSINDFINLEDVPHVPQYQTSEATEEAFSGPWNDEVVKNGTKPNIKRALFAAHSSFFWFALVNISLFIILSATQPFVITLLLEYVDSKNVYFLGMNSGYGIAITLGLISFVNAFVLNAAMYFCYSFAMAAKSSLIAKIFRKALSVSTYTSESRSVGDIITLMSVDVERIWFGMLLCPWLIMCPAMILVAIVLLLVKTGLATVFVCLFVVCLGLSLERISKQIGRIREQIIKHTVARTLLVNETLQGIRVVKMYSWERFIREKIESTRKEEVRLLRKYLFYKMIGTVCRFLICEIVQILIHINAVAGFAFHSTISYVILALYPLCADWGRFNCQECVYINGHNGSFPFSYGNSSISSDILGGAV